MKYPSQKLELTAEQQAALDSDASGRIVVGDMRTGKTTVGATAVAAAFYENCQQPKTIWVVGFDERHVSQTLWRVLEPLICPETVEWEEFTGDRPLPREARAYNGNVIKFFASTTMKCKSNDKVDLLWVDEDVWREQHVSEWVMRTQPYGRWIWTTTDMPESLYGAKVFRLTDWPTEEMRVLGREWRQRREEAVA